MDIGHFELIDLFGIRESYNRTTSLCDTAAPSSCENE